MYYHYVFRICHNYNSLSILIRAPLGERRGVVADVVIDPQTVVVKLEARVVRNAVPVPDVHVRADIDHLNMII